jgi:hypothetical protein
VTDEFAEAWSVNDHRHAEEEHRRRLGLVINLENDDAGQSSRPHRRRWDTGQGCSYLPQTKEELRCGDEAPPRARAWQQRRLLDLGSF